MSNRKFLALLAAMLPVACAAQEVAKSAEKMYQLDMFSLISFGLAIAALLLSLFMAWLSWEFYKKSTETSDKTNETVTRVETLVAGVQSSISDIVERAVSHWIEGGVGADGNINQSKIEVYDKLNALEQTIQKGGNGNSEELLKEVSALKTQMDELGRGIRENQIKALFPSISEPMAAIKYSQEVTKLSDHEQVGVIKVTVQRPTRVATATLRFKPNFPQAPELKTTLISSPYGENTSEISAKHGTPSATACNIHLNGSSPLKVGEYVFEFVANSK
jgi:CHASE3 domain sensor protein